MSLADIFDTIVHFNLLNLVWVFAGIFLLNCFLELVSKLYDREN